MTTIIFSEKENAYIVHPMKEEDFQLTRELVTRDFELESQEKVLSEEELLELLADQIAYMIDARLEFLLSLMYRLDIDERKVHQALSPSGEEPANWALARLVLDRQKQRAFTKRYYKQDDLDGWEWREDC